MRRIQALLVTAALAAAPAGAAAGPSHDSSSTRTFERFEWSTSKGRLGAMVMSLTPELRAYFGAATDRGVLVAHVDPGTPAAEAGITPGDVIVEVHGRTIDAATDVLSAIADVTKGQKVAIQLVRDRKPMSLDVTLTGDARPNLFDPTWTRIPWLRELMKPLATPAPAFDELNWFHELLHPAKPDRAALRS